MVGNFLDCSLLLRLHVYYMATVVCHTLAITVITCFAKLIQSVIFVSRVVVIKYFLNILHLQDNIQLVFTIYSLTWMFPGVSCKVRE